ncbi:unnamed protein product [Urochloa decumbens]|uniref:LEAF RUST 10 DISEASE-RESISTANCE LOCUS RECEPTOR-LIKE PROTEIN KINASE-like 1.2 n=1 Tax=Urochloa decumbens TaxID=240449 RepID=A0ABC9H4T7_9POAL
MMSPPRLLATAMATHLPRLPFLLFVFLAVHVPASHGDPAPLPTTYEASMCSNSVMCGGVNITYPFYLSNETRETADYSGYYYSCGYTDLEISCKVDGRTGTPVPVIHLDGYNYTVLNISYNSSTIVLADSDVLSGPAPCHEPRHNVTFDYKWLQYNTSNYDYENLTFFSGCYSKPGDSVPPGFNTTNFQINCSGSPQGGPPSFVFTDEELGTDQAHELASHCDENVIVPVQRDVLIKYEYMLAMGGYVDVLEMGFALEWNRVTEATDQCYRCEGSGGRCAYGQSKAFLGCLCSGGKVGNPDCKGKSSVLLSYLAFQYHVAFSSSLASCHLL